MNDLAWNLETGVPSCEQACKGNFQASPFRLGPWGAVMLKTMQCLHVGSLPVRICAGLLCLLDDLWNVTASVEKKLEPGQEIEQCS